MRAAAQTVHPAAQAKNVNVLVESHAPGAVLGDADRLQQIVWNLLSNAIKFTPAGGTVRAVVSELDDSVQLVVSDTGEGIDADFLPNVFERFRQADGTHRREGLGLGLAIVKELVELHGGTIRVSSAGKGQGTTFRATLPKYVPTAFAETGDVPSTVLGEADSPAEQRQRAASESRASRRRIGTFAPATPEWLAGRNRTGHFEKAAIGKRLASLLGRGKGRVQLPRRTVCTYANPCLAWLAETLVCCSRSSP